MNESPADQLSWVAPLVDAALAWLRTPFGWSTVSRAEAIFIPAITVALLLHLWRLVQSSAALRRHRRDSDDGSLLAVAKENVREARFGSLRLGLWLFATAPLLVNWPWSTVPFTLGALAYAAVEVADVVLGRLYLFDRARYYEAEQRRLAAKAEIVEATRREATDHRNRLEAAIAETKAAVEENKTLLKDVAEKTGVAVERADTAGQKADAAYHEANTVNLKLEHLGLVSEADRAADREERQADREERQADREQRRTDQEASTEQHERMAAHKEEDAR